MVFPVVMYGCESWSIKKAECQRIDIFELWCWRRLESVLDSKEIKPVNPKGPQPWIFPRSTDAEAPILWPPDEKSWLTGKDPDAEKDWGWEEKWTTEDVMVGWHHRLNGYEFEQTLGGSKGGRPGMLQFMELQRVGHGLATEQQHSLTQKLLYINLYT